MAISKKDERILKLLNAGGTDKELSVLEEVIALEDKVDSFIEEIRAEFATRVDELKADLPNLSDVLSSVRGAPGKDGVDGRTPITVSDTAPDKPQIGDLWYQP